MSGTLHTFLDEFAELVDKYHRHFEHLANTVCLGSGNSSQIAIKLDVIHECAQAIERIEDSTCQHIRTSINTIQTIQTNNSQN